MQLAVQIRDTPEVVQEMNNIGMNYRRIGILSEGPVFHYGALLLYGQYSDYYYGRAKELPILGKYRWLK